MTSQVRTTVNRSVDEVASVLSDGWLYPLWVVGATSVRSVDETWPHQGARLHHTAGSWPVVLNDHTEVVECDLPRTLSLDASGWPLGRARVDLELEPIGEHRCSILLREDASGGPGRLVPEPVRRLVLTWRNRESLRRLVAVAEGRTG